MPSCILQLFAEKPSRAATIRCAAACLIVGGALRIMFRLLQPILLRDEIFYLTCMEQWPHLSAYIPEDSQYLPPLFLQLGSVLVHCGFSPVQAGFLINFPAGMGTLAGIYFIGRRLCGNNWFALCALALGAVHPVLVQSSGSLLREALYLFFMTGVLCLLAAAVTGAGTAKLWCGAGICAGLGFLTRFEGIELWILSAGLLIIMCFRKKMTVREGLKAGGALIAGTAGILLFWYWTSADASYFSNSFRHYANFLERR